MIDKNMIVNLTLSALRLNYQTTDADNDTNKVVKAIMKFYRLGLSRALTEMDLNRTSTKVKLELLDLEHPHWTYVYKYPSKCTKFRKIVSPFVVDNKTTLIPSATESVNKIDCILTNEQDAYADIIPEDLNLSVLSPSAALTCAYAIAMLLPNMIVGKDSRKIKLENMQDYSMYLAQAQLEDENENVDTTPDFFKSEFVTARLGAGWLKRG